MCNVITLSEPRSTKDSEGFSDLRHLGLGDAARVRGFGLARASASVLTLVQGTCFGGGGGCAFVRCSGLPMLGGMHV